MSQSGVAEAFRVQSKSGRTWSNSVTSSISSSEGILEEDRKCLSTSILNLVAMLSDVLFANRQVMGEVRTLTQGGSAEMVLMAIQALRKGKQFTKLLLASMDRFLDSA